MQVLPVHRSHTLAGWYDGTLLLRQPGLCCCSPCTESVLCLGGEGAGMLRCMHVKMWARRRQACRLWRGHERHGHCAANREHAGSPTQLCCLTGLLLRLVAGRLRMNLASLHEAAGMLSGCVCMQTDRQDRPVKDITIAECGEV